MTVHEMGGEGFLRPHLHFSDSEAADAEAEAEKARQHLESELGHPVTCRKVSEVECSSEEELQEWANELLDRYVVTGSGG